MLCIKNGRLVSPAGIKTADLWVEDGKIIEPPAAPADFELIDAEGCLVFPGFIDAHTHLQMPAGGIWTADSFASGTAAALAGGTTTIIDFATQDKGETLGAALKAWRERADNNCHCDYSFHMAITDWNEKTRAELPEMLDAGITSFKTYMAYDNLRITDEELYALLCETAGLGALVGVHCELGDEVNAGRARLIAEGKTGTEWHPVSRPNWVESEAVKRFLELAARADAPAWVVHLSTAEGLAEIEAARKNGQVVYTETCPQYLTFTDEVYSRTNFEGAEYVCSPPIRKAADKNALLGALGDKIDFISTDHCSYNIKGQKDAGMEDFTKIPNGLPGIELRPALVWSQCGLTPERFCALLSENPARTFGMYPQKGSLLPGADADIVIWDESMSATVRTSELIMKADHNPWEGFELRGLPRLVLLRGETENKGRFIKRNTLR